MSDHSVKDEEKNVVYTEDVDKRIAGSSSTTNEKDTTPNNVWAGTPEERRLKRKINAFIYPLCGLIIFVQFCDKAALSVAPVLGLNTELGLTGSQFSWLGSIFYLGYLVFQPPNNLILQRVPHGKYLSVLLVAWGSVMTLTALCNDFSSLMACRFLLGFFEAAALPALYIIIATLYRRREQTIVFGYVTLCNGVGAAIGSATSYGIAHMKNARGITNWRWGQIIYGVLTITIGIVCWFFLIDKPKHRLLRLTEQEKLISDERTQDNAVVKVKTFKWYQIREALTEIRYYLMMLAAVCINLQNGGMLVFSTTFTLGLGFTPLTSLLLQIPSGLSSSLGVLICTIVARKTRQLCYTAFGGLSVGLIGLILLLAIPSGGVKLLGYYLSWASTGSYALIITMIGNNVKGYTKKIFYNGSLMCFYTIGNFCGPLMMVAKQAPRYLGGIGGFLGGYVVALICYIIMRIWMSRENKRRLANLTGEPCDIYQDLTDREDKNFIYLL